MQTGNLTWLKTHIARFLSACPARNLGFVNLKLKLWREKNTGAVQERIWWEDEWKEMIRLNANAPSP